MKKEDYIVYDYIHRGDVISDNKIETLNKVYSLSYPKAEKSFLEMCKDIDRKAEEVGQQHNKNFRLEWMDEEKKRTYVWPCDFFYIPEKILREIWDNRREAYGIEQHWHNDIESLIGFLFEKSGLKEVYTETEYSNGEKVRHSIEQKLLKDVIGEDAAAKTKEILEDYLHTYKWGLMDVNQFSSGYLSTPTTNREAVERAWKIAFNKDIKIPSDECWIDEYEFADKEYEGEFDNDEENKTEAE